MVKTIQATRTRMAVIGTFTGRKDDGFQVTYAHLKKEIPEKLIVRVSGLGSLIYLCMLRNSINFVKTYDKVVWFATRLLAWWK